MKEPGFPPPPPPRLATDTVDVDFEDIPPAPSKELVPTTPQTSGMEREELLGGSSVQRNSDYVSSKDKGRRRTRGSGEGKNTTAKEDAVDETTFTPNSNPDVSVQEAVTMHAGGAEALTPPAPDEPASEQETLTIDPTPKETRGLLKKAVMTVERQSLQEKETAFLKAQSELARKDTLWNRLRRGGAAVKDQRERVEALKAQYNEARITYAQSIQKEVDAAATRGSSSFEKRAQAEYERLQNAGALSKDADGKEEDLVTFTDRVGNERATRVGSYLQSREIIRGVEKKIEQARQQGLNERQQDTFGKALSWMGRQNKKLESLPGGKTTAIAFRSLAGAIGISGLAAATGSALAVGSFGVVGFGSYRLARSLLGAFAGKIVGDAAGEFYEKRLGANDQEKAEQSLQWQGRHGAKQIQSVEDLERLDTVMQKLGIRAAGETDVMNGLVRIKKKDLVRGVFGFLGGAGAGYSSSALFDLPAVQNAAHTLVTASAEVSEKLSANYVSGAGLSEAVTTDTVAEQAAANPVWTAEIQQGEGFNSLFAELRAAHPEGDSLVVRHLMDSNLSASELSAEIKALVSGASAEMQVGDKLFVGDDGNLHFERDGKSMILMEEKDGKLVTHSIQDFEGMDMRPDASSVEDGASNSGDTSVKEIDTAENTSEADPSSPDPDSAEYADKLTREANSPASGPEDASSKDLEVTTNADQTESPETPDAAVSSEQAGPIQAPWEFPDMATEPFTNAHGIEINPKVPTAFADTNGNVMVYGGTYDAQAEFAKAYALSHPDTPVAYEGRPLEYGDSYQRWTNMILSDDRGQVTGGTEKPTSPIQIGRIIDSATFTSKLP